MYWCDSSVVLAWLSSPDPSKLKTLVANRVSEIGELTNTSAWRYVPSGENPADLISRGVTANQLRNLDLWWSGPSFLQRGHFLVGRPLTALPTPRLEDRRDSSLARYERLEKIRQHFWSRWQKEYVAELQQRKRWRLQDSRRLNIGDLVLIQEENTPPLCWRLGRVLKLFSGSDGVARVADIVTTRGCTRRPLVKLCPLLPLGDEP